MRAAGEPLLIEDVDVGEPGAQEVLIDVAAVGLCHSDLVFLDGSYQQAVPAVLGHESAGVVARVGKGVGRVQPGDRVITSLSASCGRCAYCRESLPHLCSRKDLTRRGSSEPPRLTQGGEEVHQFLDLSSFAERMLVHESTVVRIPSEVPTDRAALLGCGVATGLGAIFNTARVQRGQSVCVIGCGGVGLAAIQGARIAGASQVIAVDTMPEKLEVARSLGATDVVDANFQDPIEAVRQLADGEGVHHSIEAFGSVSTAEQAFAILRRGGTATVVGLIPGQELSIPTDQLFYERKIQGSVMGSNDFQRDTRRYIDMYLDGALNLDDLVTQHLTLEEINRGFDDMRSGTGVRSIVVFE